MAVIEVNHLSKYYGRTRGIVDVSFQVEEGEIYGFIGPNGAGKSTTIRALLGLIYPSGGNARIFGQDCIEKGPIIRRDIGYLPSEVFYYDNMKVIDLLKYSASFYPSSDYQRIYELSEMLDLDLKRKIEDLSYGNRKKVGIVQGLLHSPRLIILDEPTGGLDPLMQQKFFQLIKSENQHGASVLFSSHILTEVQKLCSRVAIIKEGIIIGIEDMRTLGRTSYKRFVIELAEVVDENYFDLPGTANLKYEDGSFTFLFQGEINQIVDRIHKHQIKNLIVEEPSLEEVFLHYYEPEGEQ